MVGTPKTNYCSTVVAASRQHYSLGPDATPDQIKDALLRNHSHLKTPSLCAFAFQYIQQKPDEALQIYNTRYESFNKLAHPGFTIEDPATMVSCIHYAASLHGKLGDEMEGRFNQDLSDNLKAAFDKAVNFEPRILTKQWINTRKVNEVNHTDVRSVKSIKLTSGTLDTKVRIMILITKTCPRIITIIPVTNLDLVPTSQLTIMEGISTTRTPMQKSHPTFKSPSLDQSTRTRCTKFTKF